MYIYIYVYIYICIWLAVAFSESLETPLSTVHADGVVAMEYLSDEIGLASQVVHERYATTDMCIW